MATVISLPSKEYFFGAYNITDEEFEKSGLDWDDLEEIHTDYQSRYDEFDRAAFTLVNTLIKMDKVHSVRYRIKDPEHVIEKIIRKKVAQPKRVITKETYFKELTDLIGLRAIHLFKDDWFFIHQAVLDKWHQKEKPTYYCREGDNLESKKFYRDLNCKVVLHKRNYRSVHYIIKTNPTKQEYFAEIQVRTLFEEGWSEIDHKVGYPRNTENKLLNDFLSILNRLAGSADEMGTFLKKLQPKLAEIQLKSEESERKVEEVKADIDNSPTLTDPEKEKLLKRVSELDGFSATKIMRDLTANLASIPDFSSLFVPIKGISGLSPEVLKSLENSNAAAMAGYASLFRSLEKSPLQSKKKKNKDE